MPLTGLTAINVQLTQQQETLKRPPGFLEYSGTLFFFTVLTYTPTG
jgi:hypothetical protein